MLVHGGHAIHGESRSTMSCMTNHTVFDFTQRVSDSAFLNSLFGVTLKEAKEARRLALERLVKQTE